LTVARASWTWEVSAMTAISIAGMGLTGVLRITWIHDNLAHVLDHSHTDETTGTWIGLACPGHGLALGTDVDNATLQRLATGSEIADLVWEASDELTADHAQVFQAAMRAHHAGDSRGAPSNSGRTSRPSGRRPGQRTTCGWGQARLIPARSPPQQGGIDG
jgi:hypothetical protein